MLFFTTQRLIEIWIVFLWTGALAKIESTKFYKLTIKSKAIAEDNRFSNCLLFADKESVPFFHIQRVRFFYH